MTRNRILAFDVNETLLDVAALDPLFEELTGDASLRPVWFSQMLQVAFVGGITGRYVDFSAAQAAALRMVAARAGVTLPGGAEERVVAAMRSLPLHGDARPALERLAGEGFTVVALTNSPLPVVTAQLANAGASALFTHVLSADQVGALKPAAAAYHLAARSCGTGIGNIRLIAAHAWDVAGALAAGCAAAFVTRSGAVPSPIGPRPDIVESGLEAVAERIVALDG